MNIANKHEDLIDCYVLQQYQTLLQSRYLFRNHVCKANQSVLDFLETMGVLEIDNSLSSSSTKSTSSVDSWIDDDDFQREFWVAWYAFIKLHQMIKDHPVFDKKQQGPPQIDTRFQLLVFLWYLGINGNGNTNHQMKLFFNCSVGVIQKTKQQVLTAVLSLKNIAIKWPDKNKRDKIVLQFQQNYNFPNCVYIADRTLFLLATKPQVEDAADYNGRKLGYTINAILICDDERRVRHYLAGNPETCHDERAFWQLELAKTPLLFLSKKQYGFGDLAFTPQDFLVPAYKKPLRGMMLQEHEKFNSLLSKPRVLIEHVNGMLKCQFRILNNLPMLLQNKETMIIILQYIDASIILHNLLLDMHNMVPDNWLDKADDILDIDETDADKLEEYFPILTPDQANTECREQIMLYHNEVIY